MSLHRMALTLLVLLGLQGAARGALLAGPRVADVVPAHPEKVLLWVGWKAVADRSLPGPLVEAIADPLAQGRQILIIGHTDSVGPRLLNDGLGLQYAIDVAKRLADAHGVPTHRFTCASRGEEEERPEPGVALYAIDPPVDGARQRDKTAVILNPVEGAAPTAELWAFWDVDAEAVLWGQESLGDTALWRIVSSQPVVRLPFPAVAAHTALGSRVKGAQSVDLVGTRAVTLDPMLMLAANEMEDAWSSVAAQIPEGYRDVYVWGGSIPYPVDVVGGVVEAKIVRYAPEMKVWLQATDPRGEVRVGPPLTLPGPIGKRPGLVAVLTWSGDGADLDLHGWRGKGHTSPLDPDPDLSSSGAEGVYLLFDGDGRSRASALWAMEEDGLEAEVRLFSDLGEGASAMLYVIEQPGDALFESRTMYGPRRLANDPMQLRWPALYVRTNAEGASPRR